MSLKNIILNNLQNPYKYQNIYRRTLLLIRGSDAASRRFLRGRSAMGSDVASLNERQIENYDEEMEFPSNKNFLRHKARDNNEFLSYSKDQSDDSQEWTISNERQNNRKYQRSANVFERAKHNVPDFNYDFNDGGYVQKRNDTYDSRNRYNNDKYNTRDRFNNNAQRRNNYNRDLSRDRDFDFDDKDNNRFVSRDERQRNERDHYKRDNYNDRNNYRNQYNDRDVNRDRYRDNRDNRNRPFQNYQNYQNYNRNERHDYNNRYDRRSPKEQFNFEEGRPRFSKIREYEAKQMEKSADINDNDDPIDSFLSEPNDKTEENENDESFESQIDKKKRTRTLESMPYIVTKENRFEILNQIMCPLHYHRYETQLQIKYKKNVQILGKFGLSLKHFQSPVVRDAKGLPCPLELVKASPVIDSYRNKDEFSVWPGFDGIGKTVGFFVGEPSKHNNVVCIEPEEMIITKQSHKDLAIKFQNYLRDVSPYDYCLNYGDGGNWRRFVVRSNDEGHHMVVAIMHPQQLTDDELNEEMNRLKSYFNGDERINSLYFQAAPHTRCTNEQAPYRLLYGETHLKERLFDQQFLISPDTFFQINRSGAEVLYRNAISEINPTKGMTILDICCGTGTLACLISPEVHRVIGIDSNPSSIDNAKRNAEINGFKNLTFLCGAVEEQLPQLMDELYANELVVVANPTRAGLHASVIHTLREISHIKKLVYISCKPEDYAMKNFIHLCIPPKGKHLGPPFVPVNAVPVDLFPHTNHCELIITFERFH